MTDDKSNLVWFGDYYDWGKLKSETNVTVTAYQSFRLQNQYADSDTGLHYNFVRYYEPHSGRFVNQDPIGLEGGDNIYLFSPNIQSWIDPLGLHHTYLPQRLGSNKAHEAWNLSIATPWAYTTMNPFRHIGSVLLKILKGTSTW